MNRFLFWLAGIFILNFSFATAQKMEYGSWSVHCTPSQFIFKEFPLSIEKYIGHRNTIGLHYARKFGKDISGDSLGLRSINHFYFKGYFNAETIAINSKWYFDKARTSYIDLVLFKRYWWYDKVTYFFDGIPRTTQDKMDVYGIKLLVGYTIVQPDKWRFKPYMSAFAGIGIRFKQFQSEIFNSEVGGVLINYGLEENHGYLPSIQAGINVGVMHYSKPIKTPIF